MPVDNAAKLLRSFEYFQRVKNSKTNRFYRIGRIVVNSQLITYFVRIGRNNRGLCTGKLDSIDIVFKI